ncbi:MAG: ATP-binding cassette domain-containing protein, partial [Hyphomicrobiales bacterium]
MAARQSTDAQGLCLRQVRICLGGSELVSVDMCIKPGEVATVMGASGSGKSTLLAFVGGFLAADFTATGSVVLAGRDITGIAAHQRAVGILFQDDLLFPHLSVAGNAMFAIPASVRG